MTAAPRPPGAGDAAALAALHHQAWAETYAGLLPQAEIDRYDLPFRLRQWEKILSRGTVRVLWLPGQGFGMMGAQREAALAADWPDELYALYLLRRAQGQGLGRALLSGLRERPFTTLVIAGNTRAERFYAAAGGVELARRDDPMAGASVTEVLLGFAG